MSWPQLCSRINTPSSASSSRRRQPQDRVGPRAQHQRVEHARMIASQERQRPRQGHNHVFVFNRQKIPLHLVGPEKPLRRAALRAMPIFTAMEHLHFLPAALARPVVRAQHLRAADQQLAQHPILLHSELRADLPPVLRAEGANHVGDFQRGCPRLVIRAALEIRAVEGGLPRCGRSTRGVRDDPWSG